MGQRFEGTAFRYVAGALLIIALLASGYLLGVTQFKPPEPEPALAETQEWHRLMEVVQSMDGTMAALTEQVAQLHVDVADLQERLAEQGTAVEALSGTFLTFSSEMTGQVEATTAQLQVLVAAAESGELEALLTAVETTDQSVADLAQQVAQLQQELAALQSTTAEQNTEVQSLAAALETLSSQVAEHAKEAAQQLQVLTAAAERDELEPVLNAVESLDTSIAGLGEQLAKLQVELEALQSRSAEQDRDMEALATSLSALSVEVTGQAENTQAKLQELAAAVESTGSQLQTLAASMDSTEQDAVLTTLESLDASVAGLSAGLAQLQEELTGLMTSSTQQSQEVQTLAVAVSTLAQQVAEEAQSTTARLETLEAVSAGAELQSLVTELRSIDRSLANLAEQVTQLHLELASLQTASSQQGQEVQSLAAALATLADDLAEQREPTAAQLQALTEAVAVQAVAPAKGFGDAMSEHEAEERPEAPQAPAVSLEVGGDLPVLSALAEELIKKNQAMILTIKPRDTIWGIANRFQSPPSEKFINQIIELNQVDPYRLRIGQDLLIPLNEEIFRLVEVE